MSMCVIESSYMGKKRSSKMKVVTKKPIFLLTIFKCFIFIACFVMFVLLMKEVYDKYTSKMTSSGISLYSDDVTEKNLPYLTFCAWPVKRTPGIHFTKDDFKKNSYDLNEFFHNVSLANFNASYTVTNISSIYFGQCFTLQKTVCAEPSKECFCPGLT